jgi:hypothetical protein
VVDALASELDDGEQETLAPRLHPPHYLEHAVLPEGRTTAEIRATEKRAMCRMSRHRSGDRQDDECELADGSCGSFGLGRRLFARAWTPVR